MFGGREGPCVAGPLVAVLRIQHFGNQHRIGGDSHALLLAKRVRFHPQQRHLGGGASWLRDDSEGPGQTKQQDRWFH